MMTKSDVRTAMIVVASADAGSSNNTKDKNLRDAMCQPKVFRETWVTVAHRMTCLELLGFLGESETGKSWRCASVADLDPQRSIRLGAGLAQNGKGSQSFVIDLRDQVGVAGVFLFPYLTDLYFLDRHAGKSERSHFRRDNGGRQ